MFSRAPTDCVQWFTGVEGYVQSYGFGSGQLLSSQNYQACVRQEKEYCAIEWAASTRTTPDSFGLLHAATAGFGESTIGTCVSSYVNIPGAINYPNLPTINNMCGEGWAKDGVAAELGPLRCKYHKYHISEKCPHLTINSVISKADSIPF